MYKKALWKPEHGTTIYGEKPIIVVDWIDSIGEIDATTKNDKGEALRWSFYVRFKNKEVNIFYFNMYENAVMDYTNLLHTLNPDMTAESLLHLATGGVK